MASALNFLNRTLYHGENLDFLRGMNSETVDLVATDPPFKKGRDFHATPDSLAAGAKFEDRWSWDDDVHEEWVDQLHDDWRGVYEVIDAAKHAAGMDMAAFLCWLGVRVIEMHRVLAPTGSLYLHIDHTAHAWTKAMLDAIFGRKQFRNEIVWGYRRWPAKSKHFQRMHDTILRYTRSDTFIWNQQYDQLSPSSIKQWQGKRRVDVVDTVTGRRHSVTEDSESQGVPMRDVWELSVVHPASKEHTGYPTQKPLALYERIVKASSNEGDMVLDPFAGCATTPVAAERLGRQWVGMDVWDGAFDVVKQRMEDNRQLLGDIPEIHYSTAPPVRSDGGQAAAPELRLKVQVAEPPGPRMTHAEMKAVLIQNEGLVCRGCLRTFDDDRYLELDHNTPRSDGGLNHISNRLLLCGPCNRAKSNTLTLSGLRKLNQQNGWMAPS